MIYKLEDIASIGVTDSSRGITLYKLEELPGLIEFQNGASRFTKSANKAALIYSVFNKNWTIVVNKGVLTLSISGHNTPMKFSTNSQITALKKYLKD